MNRLILCGDFNAHHGMWGSSQNNTNGRVLVSLLDNHDHVTLNSSSLTHFSLTSHRLWSLLDLTIVSNSIASNCSTKITNNFLGSDHSIIHTTVNGVHLQETQFLPKWNFSKADWPKFAEMCDRTLLSFSPTLEHSYQLFETYGLEASKEFIPQTKRYTKILVPWWNKECEQAIKNRKHAFTRMKRTRSPVAIIIFKRCRAKARQIILELKLSSWHNYCNSLKSNSLLTQFWRTIKKFSGQRSCYHIPSLQQNGIIAKSNQHKANMLAQKFHSVSKTNPPGSNTSFQNLCSEAQLVNLSTSPQNSHLNSCFLLS